jgi:hypothetical protein
MKGVDFWEVDEQKYPIGTTLLDIEAIYIAAITPRISPTLIALGAI